MKTEAADQLASPPRGASVGQEKGKPYRREGVKLPVVDTGAAAHVCHVVGDHIDHEILARRNPSVHCGGHQRLLHSPCPGRAERRRVGPGPLQFQRPGLPPRYPVPSIRGKQPCGPFISRASSDLTWWAATHPSCE